MREQGYLSIAIINYLARLGHACDTQELLAFQKLAQHFYLEKISKSPARFDTNQLLFWQKLAVQAQDQVALMQWIGPSILKQVPALQQNLFLETIQKNIVFPHDALEWANIFFHDQINIDDVGLQTIREAGENFFVQAQLLVDKYGTELPTLLNEMKQTLSVNGKKLFMPLRMALTGKLHGPELAPIASLLGKEKMKHRFAQALQRINDK